jgi:hypothetical protein
MHTVMLKSARLSVSEIQHSTAELCHDPEDTNLGQHPGGCASHHCEVHTCVIIFGTWPLCHYDTKCVTSHPYLTVSRLPTWIKHEHAEPAVTRARPHLITIPATSIPHFLPTCFLQSLFSLVPMTHHYHSSPQSHTYDFVPM